MRATARALASFAAASAVLLLAGATPRGASPRFYSDDPLAREPETQDAAHVADRDVPLIQDLLLNLFARPGDHRQRVAGDINTADEVPDSSWFTNRIYARPVSVEEIARGPNASGGPSPGRLTVVAAKVSGITPGFTVQDVQGVQWFVQFDAHGYPRAATSAVAVACRLFWALGYNQVESYLTVIDPDQLDIDPNATVRPRPGLTRPLRRSDVEAVLRRADRGADGGYRAIAGRAVPGRPVGPFQYYGTRPDDPNDLVPHEHRRSLRALKVFGAWTNLVDMKAGNTLDTVVAGAEGPRVVHYLQDVGSTFGTSALGPRDWDEGYENLFEATPLLRRLYSVGFYLRPWQTVPYRERPELGRFEGAEFDPLAWRPRVPTAALDHARDDDTFWAALRVTAFSEAQIRAAVHAGEYTDPVAERLLGDVLVQRRDAIGRAYLARLAPLTGFALGPDGLSFDNVAERVVGLPPPDGGYTATWSAYDNATGAERPLGATTAPGTSRVVPLPAGVDAGVSILKVTLAAADARHPAWARGVDVYFRRQADQLHLIGVERLPPAGSGPTSLP
jgi:hypothetical protein